MRLLVDAREKADLTQRDVASSLRVTPSWVAKVEMRERRLDVVEFVRVARAVKADPVQLLAEVVRHIRG